MVAGGIASMIGSFASGMTCRLFDIIILISLK